MKDAVGGEHGPLIQRLREILAGGDLNKLTKRVIYDKLAEFRGSKLDKLEKKIIKK